MAAKIKPTFLPSVFTSGNLFCGMLAIVYAINGNAYRGAWFIVLAAFFDVTDGYVARLTGQSSRFGVELDSLADVVSFVVAPMMLLYPLALRQYAPFGIRSWLIGAVFAFLFVVAGTIRLARFNVEIKSLTVKSDFRGLPTPAAGCLVAGYLIFCKYFGGEIPGQQYLPYLVTLLALLMISGVEYPAVSTIAKRSLHSYVIYGLMVIVMIGAVIRREITIFPAMLLYVLLGPVGWGLHGVRKLTKAKDKRRDKGAES